MTSDKPIPGRRERTESTSDTTPALGQRRRGRAPVPLPVGLEATLAGYTAKLAAATVLDDDTRRAYTSRVRQYLAWLHEADIVDGDPLTDPAARDGAVRDYRAHLQTVAKRTAATINNVLTALADFYQRSGLGTPEVRRLNLLQRAPRSLTPRDVTRWQRAVERWLNPRDRLLAAMPLYAGLRIGEVVALDLDDIHRSACQGLIIVRSGRGDRYRQVPIHPDLREHLDVWIDDERPTWPGATETPALLLNRRGGRLGTRGARDIITAIADDANLRNAFTSHVLRHSFGTMMIRDHHDIVLVAALMGHRRLKTTRAYTRPTACDREAAINSIPSDR